MFAANKNGTSQSLANNTFTKVTFDNEVIDTGSEYDPTLSRFTPVVGPVSIVATVQISGLQANTNFVLMLYKNGTSVAEDSKIVGTLVGYSLTLSVPFIDEANGTDYYEVFVTAKGTTLQVQGNARYTRFQGR